MCSTKLTAQLVATKHKLQVKILHRLQNSMGLLLSLGLSFLKISWVLYPLSFKEEGPSCLLSGTNSKKHVQIFFFSMMISFREGLVNLSRLMPNHSFPPTQAWNQPLKHLECYFWKGGPELLNCWNIMLSNNGKPYLFQHRNWSSQFPEVSRELLKE